MLKIGLVGLGFMGRTHLETWARLEREGLPVQVAAICDTDAGKLEGSGGGGGNLDTAASGPELERYRKYTDVNEMLEKEQLDFVDLALPTYVHKEISVLCLNRGLHVLCEKPMAMSAEECSAMIAAAEANGKRLLIGQCLRFWPAYVYLKELNDGGTFGKALGATFFRGGGTPTWADWLTQKEKSGGALMDMHVHDADMVHWLFGKPESVSCHARNVVPGSGYDIVSTHYAYDDGKVVNAQVDWTLQGEFGFEMSYRVNFEKGNVVFQGGKVRVNPNDAASFTPDLSGDMGYYFELKYFAECLLNGTPMDAASPESTKGTIEIVEAEMKSADLRGAWVEL